jgi:hypothetical protein
LPGCLRERINFETQEERMKRLMIVLIAAMFLFSFSAQAMAYFEDDHLIRIVYGGDKEIATDLGTGWDLSSPTAANHLFDENNFSKTDLGVSDWSTVKVAYFIVEVDQFDGLTANTSWTSGPETGQSIKNHAFDMFAGQAHYVTGMNYQSGDPQNVYLQSDGNSYKTQMAPPGSFAGYLAVYNGEASMAALDTVGYVDQLLYYYATPDDASAGVPLYTIRSWANGTTEINPNVVPIPAAVYLLGSGLLGLIGIRRRMAA